MILFYCSGVNIDIWWMIWKYGAYFCKILINEVINFSIYVPKLYSFVNTLSIAFTYSDCQFYTKWKLEHKFFFSFLSFTGNHECRFIPFCFRAFSGYFWLVCTYVKQIICIALIELPCSFLDPNEVLFKIFVPTCPNDND